MKRTKSCDLFSHFDRSYGRKEEAEARHNIADGASTGSDLNWPNRALRNLHIYTS
jgi:hypothetical protein